MDEPVNILIASFVGLTIGVPVLAFYTYLLFKLGMFLGRNLRTNFPYPWAIFLICLAWIPVSCITLLLPATEFMVFSAFVSLHILNTYPCVIGFATGRHFKTVDERNAFRRNVDHWLSEWECSDADGIDEAELKRLTELPPDQSNPPQ